MFSTGAIFSPLNIFDLWLVEYTDGEPMASAHNFSQCLEVAVSAGEEPETSVYQEADEDPCPRGAVILWTLGWPGQQV